MSSKDYVIAESLSLVAERAGDVTSVIYEKYFMRCPSAEEVMSHLDAQVLGKMMEEVYRLLMVNDYESENDYLNWEVSNHETAYNVEPHMYEEFFSAVIDSVREVMGSQWTPALERVWESKCEELRSEIARRFSVN